MLWMWYEIGRNRGKHYTCFKKSYKLVLLQVASLISIYYPLLTKYVNLLTAVLKLWLSILISPKLYNKVCPKVFFKLKRLGVTGNSSNNLTDFLKDKKQSCL